jgi:multiple sugar transport system ATP-binding protein
VRVDGELAVAEGDTVYLTPDAKRLHRFDEQGKALR